MAKTRQIRLPGLESDADLVSSAVADSAREFACEFPDTPATTSMGLDSAERLVEPVEQGLVPNLAGKSVYVVDAYSLIFQVFHALSRSEMTSPRGEPTGAVFGFSRDMIYLIDEKQADYLLAAFDVAGPTFRDELFTAYKENRSEMPSELAPQIPNIRPLVAETGSPIPECEGFEADDVLATVARIVEQAGGRCLLVTGDKDCRQLISDQVAVYNIRKDQIMDAPALKDEWGITPEQVVDFQALTGDSVDNIPGVPLVGPKVAGEWLGKYNTLDNLLDHAEELPKGKRKENLLASRDQLPVWRRLARLHSEVPLEIDWSAARTGRFDPDGAAELFSEFGFHTLTSQMRERVKAEAPAFTHRYEAITTPERLRWLVGEMSRQTQISIDTETTSLFPRWPEIVGYSFAWKPGEADYVRVRAPAG